MAPLLRLLLPAAVLSLAGCATLPDMEVAASALARGDRASAEAQYRALAEFGLPSAQLALGDLLADGPDREARRAEARQWYERAARRDARGLGRISGLEARNPALDDAGLDALLERLLARYDRGEASLAADIADLLLARGYGRNAPEVAAWARRAVAIGDRRGDYLLGVLCDQPFREVADPGCAAPRYRASAAALPEAAGALIALAQRHPGHGTPLALAREAALRHGGPARLTVYRVYRRKAGVPQVSVAEALLAGLSRPTVAATPAADPAQAAALVDAALDPAASGWDPVAADVELADAYAANVGEDARSRLFAQLEALRRVRPLEADLIESRVQAEGNLVPRDPARAAALLQPHLEESPAAAYAYAVLLRGGDLDEPDYDGAVRWFERAGEGGLGKAWYQLTRLFLESPGFASDRARAEVYAARARASGFGYVDALLDYYDAAEATR